MTPPRNEIEGDRVDDGADAAALRRRLAEVRQELVQARRNLERLAAEADAANRAKDEFLAMLGHELRNPLSPILTTLQLMRLRGMDSPEQDVIERQVGHLTRLIDDLLDVSRITRGKIELRRRPMEVADAIFRAIETSSPVLERRRHKLEVHVPRTGLGIDADADRMTQVFANLLTNAAKYSEPGSTIRVAAERAGDRVRIRVEDQGIGIAPDMLARVFDLFVQQQQPLDRSIGGLGLGLAIVRSLVRMHDGTVLAYSEGPGKGSRFTVDLPAVAVPRIDDEAPAPHITRGLLRAENRRILVVDDNEDAADALKDALEALGYSVRVAHDGPQALEAAATFKPDIGLVDIGLPVMDGYELARRLLAAREPGRKLHLVAVTGYGQESDRARSLEVGFEDHLVKPVDLHRLIKVVKQLH